MKVGEDIEQSGGLAPAAFSPHAKGELIDQRRS